MPNFYEYNPDQAYLLPPSVRQVLGEEHLCFFVHRTVEKLDLRKFEQGYSDEGHLGYHPALLLKVWLYAYALGVTSSRRLEQRVREDLAFRYLAGGAQPDFWTLNEFRKRHRRAMNDVFTQVVELARSVGMAQLGHVAIDSTRIAANAAADSAESIEKLRGERAKIRKRIRRWQQQCQAEDPNEGAGTGLMRENLQKLEQRLAEIPVRLERLKRAGVRKLSRTDADSRFLRDQRGFTLGYTGTVAVSADHFVVAQQISQSVTDNELLVPMLDGVERECGERPVRTSADSGFFSLDNLQAMEERNIDAYVPDTNLARVLNRGGRLKQHACHPAHQRMRRKLRSPAGQAVYRRRKELAEPVMGILKEQRGMRRFRLRGLSKVAVEFTLAVTALNLTRLWRVRPQLARLA
jgi:transposase